MNKKEFSVRTKYLINPSFQITFIIYFLIIGVIALMIFYSSNLYFFKTLASEGIQLELPSDHVYFELLASQKHLMNKIFMITSAIFFILISLLGIFISHRIAGPIYKMTKTLNSFQGVDDLREIQFRKRDFFKELADSFNALVVKIKR
ncbi:MAG: hypothetical protein A2381_16000 [Bdellovibrionales bacterium RIFOXYB1_FULL_37_110]|nr:MAG: hypothetical protein A2417_07850 [Bdellovibrionales bacterium RIFOXYC1_FULL_37_79]OFZ57116.1 MAG: hypothetical protein A2381_16000 [Bdellovibrionales bacterium RIFOXYB1_FULL_37_110]OFZ65400.1 MAG: hypothetical protein A2577_03870 [Bdellovibrionales bacterium RIFOXYD1_FULL_36_51]